MFCTSVLFILTFSVFGRVSENSPKRKRSGEAAYVYFPRVREFAAKEGEFYPEMYVCIMYGDLR